MKKYLMAALMLAALCFLTSCGVDEAAWQENYDLGEKYLAEYNYEEAVLAYSEAIKIDSKQPESFVGRGTAYAMIEDDYKKAIEDYEKALKLDDSCVEAYIGLSDVYLCKKDTEKAKSVLSKGYKVTKNERLSERNEELDDLKANIDLKFERKDVSLYSDNGEKLVEFYYDLPYVSDEHLQGRKINADLRKKYEEYLKEVEDIKKQFESGELVPFDQFDIGTGNESYNKNGILSIYFENFFHLGATGVLTPYGLNYDLRTGETIQLEDLFESDPDKALKKIKDAITLERKIRLVEDSDSSWEDANKTIEEYELSSFDFYFASDGELMICIPPYELAAGVYGAFEVYSGIYYNLLPDQISSSATDGKSIFPVEFLGKKLKEAKDYYGKRYYVDGLEGGSYIEFASSPCFFAQISEYQMGYDQYERGMNKNVNWNSVIKEILVYKDDAVLDKLTGNMTYPEIVKAVGKEAVLEEPDYWYSELDCEWQYTLKFDYKGYHFYYEWDKDPDTAKSLWVWIS